MHFLDQAKIFSRSGAGGRSGQLRRESSSSSAAPTAATAAGRRLVFEAVAASTRSSTSATPALPPRRGKGGAGSNRTGPGRRPRHQGAGRHQILADDEERSWCGSHGRGAVRDLPAGRYGGSWQCELKTSTGSRATPARSGTPGEEMWGGSGSSCSPTSASRPSECRQVHLPELSDDASAKVATIPSRRSAAAGRGSSPGR